MTNPPAGWYQHPENQAYEVYWDGAQWAGAPRLRMQPPPAQPRPPEQPGWATASPPEQSWDQQPQSQDPFEQWASHTTQPSSSSPQAGPGSRVPAKLPQLVGAVVAVIALLAGGLFTVGKLTATGGAGSPKKVGEKLMAAMESGDLLGVIDVMHPAERDVLRDPFVRAMKEMKRLGVTGDGFDENAKLFSYKVEGLTIRTEAVAADVENVFMSGKTTSAVNQELKLGPVFDDVPGWEDINTVNDLMNKMSPDSATTSPSDLNDAMVTAVKYDGRWYASLGYTAAEDARLKSGKALPATGLALQGGTSPEDAVRKYMAAVEALDVEGLIAGLHPGEFGALQRYAPLFLQDAKDAVASLKQEAEFSWTITTLELEQLSNNGNTADIRVKELGISIDAGDFGTAEVIVKHLGNDVQLSIQSSDFNETYSLRELYAEQLGEDLKDSDVLWGTALSVTVREWDGAWYVAPIATFNEYLFQALSQVDQKYLKKFLAEIDPAGVLEDIPLSDALGIDGSDDGFSDDAGSSDAVSFDEAIAMATREINANVAMGGLPDSDIPAAIAASMNDLFGANLSYSARVSAEQPPTSTMSGFTNYTIVDDMNQSSMCRFLYGPGVGQDEARVVSVCAPLAVA